MEEKDVVLEKYENLVTEARKLILTKCAGTSHVDQICMNCNPSCQFYGLGNALYDLAVVKDIWAKQQKSKS